MVRGHDPRIPSHLSLDCSLNSENELLKPYLHINIINIKSLKISTSLELTHLCIMCVISVSHNGTVPEKKKHID